MHSIIFLDLPRYSVRAPGDHLNKTPLTEISLPRAIFKLAWPAMTSMMLVNVFNLVDAFWVGRLGTAALGGMTASAFLVWCLFSVSQVLEYGVNAVVARRVGQQRPTAAGLASGHGLVLALVMAVVVTAGVLPFQQQLFEALGLTPAVSQASVDYMTPILWGFPSISLWFAVEATFRGSGDTRTPMMVLAGTLTLNAVLDPVLIFGAGPVAAMGIAGAAWATIISHAVGDALLLWLLLKRPVRPHLGSGLDMDVLWSLVKVGAPIAITSLLFSVIYLFLTPIIASYGSAPVAAIGVGHRIEGLVFFTCMGFSAAASTLVGQHLGAKNPELAERAAWMTTWACAGTVVVQAALFYIFAPQIFSVFTNDPAVISHGTDYLRVIALFEVGLVGELVLEGAFSGAGNSLPPMIIGVPLTAARIPAAFLLAHGFGLGVRGVWWAIGSTTLLKGIATGLWFRLGSWKKSEL